MNRKVQLGDLCDFINGGAWSDKEYVSTGIPVLKVSNFKPSGFLLEDVSRLPNSSLEKYKKHLLQKGDMVIATVGSHPNLVNSAAGRSCVITDEVTGYLLNQNAVCVRTLDSEVLDQKYLTYLGKSFYFQHYIQSRGKGAANQMRIAISAIKEYELEPPDIGTQRRIAEILSAYDDLIENNQKQIKLLEEAAMRLYKEWFVNLRFPGYENSKIVDGVPEGWRLGRVSELAEFKRGKTITKKNAKDGNVPVVAGGLEPAYFHNVANTVAPVITISASGANAGYTRLYNTDIWASDCSYIDASYGDKLYFIYTFLKNNKEVIDNLQRGAAQPHVYAKDINALSTYIPESTIMEPFCNLVAPLFKKIAVQERLISELKQARDKLLPKLMSGEIEV
ncbi:restriction endonuclease subunit S [Clostridium tepidum]|jgi:type I restriction enzyme S subunit|uniref:Type I restriction modification DNA specificity domain-containing protein n=1 Tax=Clostridium tepidum TaxID=1962263 RepID=A0A1S9IDV7_9CLOT|nr:restriction endonuclease subunit S [Clostridium tepidum]MDU6876689.1 restriction endonuclease subunit S [Clostridium botulinum]OOO63721.1 hypothetical protein BS637_01450 [Clostridium tepidum]OOO68501.1 hypothetical protein BS638_05010 [Clostridium tepidum]